MINGKNGKTVLLIDKNATWERLKQRKNAVKDNHLQNGGTKRNSPIKQSKYGSLKTILTVYLAKFENKKRYPVDKSPRVTTSYFRLAGATDASPRTMARHLRHWIELGFIKGFQRMQRGVQILLDPAMIVWADVPAKWFPAPTNSPKEANSSPATGTSAQNAATPPLNAAALLERAQNALAHLREKHAQKSLTLS